MSRKELNRLEVLQRVVDKRLTQRKAAAMLGIGERQVRRLMLRRACSYLTVSEARAEQHRLEKHQGRSP